LFGTDFPFLTPEKWLRDWETLLIPDAVTEQILLRNAERLLGLGA
jgi:predicted TIM-barrel fold metal-dependent hydrolase